MPKRKNKTDLSVLSLIDDKIHKYSSGDPVYEEVPVGIEEFIDSPDFLNWKDVLYPGVRKLLLEFFEFDEDGWLKYDEGIVVAALGTGKSEFVSIITTYLVYRLLCLRSPQLFFRERLGLKALAPDARIQIVNCAPSGDQARKVVFGYTSSHVASCPWFRDRGYQPKDDVKSELQFPKGIYVTPGSSSAKPVLGLNLLITIFDEMSFFDKTSEIDSAKELYDQLMGRMRSRFRDEMKGKSYCLFLGISSSDVADDFTEERFKACQNEKRGFARRLSFWESKSHLFEGCEYFDYKVTDVSGELIEILKVPVVYKEEIERNPVQFLRDVAARPAISHRALFSDFTKVLESVKPEIVNPIPELGWEDGGYKKPLSFSPIDLLTRLDKIDFKNRAIPGKEYIVGLDLAKGLKDKLGFSIAHLESSVVRSSFNKEGKFVSMEMPVVGVDLMTRFVANPGQEISFAEVREVIFVLHDNFGFNIKLIVSDSFQSLDFKQIMLEAGYDYIIFSTDTNRVPYDTFWELVNDKRIIWYKHEPVFYELQRLQDLGSRIDHISTSGKDLADSLVLACYFAGGKDYINRKIDEAPKRRAFRGALGPGASGRGTGFPIQQGPGFDPGSFIK